MPSQPTYRVSLEDEVFRSMKVDNGSRTPYSDATQVRTTTSHFVSILNQLQERPKPNQIPVPIISIFSAVVAKCQFNRQPKPYISHTYSAYIKISWQHQPPKN